MTGEDSTTGLINTSESVKRRLARDSKKWNNSDNTRFRAIFPDLVDLNKIAIAEAEQAQKELEQTKAQIKRGELDLSTLDPEDRARIQADHMEKRSSGGFVVGGVLLVAVVMAFIYY